MKIGLKLWSTNRQYIPETIRLYKTGVLNYIELFTVPGSFAEYSNLWLETQIPFILHAPHSYAGLNFSLPEAFEYNRKLCEEVEQYLKLLHASYVIFHPGTNGTLPETIRQIKLMAEELPDLMSFAVIENKPLKGLKEETCVGASPDEIGRIRAETNLGFCLDFGHAACYAASVKKPVIGILKQFLQHRPSIFHFTDGHTVDELDKHLHLGKGDYDLRQFLSLITHKDASVTIETDKDFEEKLDDFEQDSLFFKRLISETSSDR